MKILHLCALSACLFSISCDSGQGLVAESVAPIVFENVSVVDVQHGELIANQTVIIEGRIIKAVGPAKQLNGPRGARVINGTGKFLIPGLWDMHVHTSDEDVTVGAFFPLFIANGVTGVRSMAADCHVENGDCGEPIPPIERVFEWREAIKDGALVGPRIIAASYYTNGPRERTESSVNNPGTEEHARAYVRLLHERRVDLVKVYSRMLREAYFAMADEANELGLEFGGHVPFLVQVTEASNAGQKSIEHITGFLEECSPDGDGLREELREASYGSPHFWEILVELAGSFDASRCEQVYSTLKQNGTWHVPTLSVERFYNKSTSPRGDWRVDERLKYVPRAEVEFWDELEKGYTKGIDDYYSLMQPHYQRSFEIAKAAYDAGVQMLAGSDSGDFGIIWGFSLHEELGRLVEAGLTPAQALQLATINPARYMGREYELGTIEAGKLADLVLLERNPLVDIANTRMINSVVANGRLFRRNDLDSVLVSVEEFVDATDDKVYSD